MQSKTPIMKRFCLLFLSVYCIKYIYIYVYNFQLSCSAYTKKMNRHTVTSLHHSFYIHLSRVSGVCSFPILLATWRASSAAWTPCNGWGQRRKLVGRYIWYIPHHKNWHVQKKGTCLKEIFIFQPLIFRWCVSFWGSISFGKHAPFREKQGSHVPLPLVVSRSQNGSGF